MVIVGKRGVCVLYNVFSPRQSGNVYFFHIIHYSPINEMPNGQMYAGYVEANLF